MITCSLLSNCYHENYCILYIDYITAYITTKMFIRKKGALGSLKFSVTYYIACFSLIPLFFTF